MKNRDTGYFFGRLGTAGGARPVETPGREGTEIEAFLKTIVSEICKKYDFAYLRVAVWAHHFLTLAYWAPLAVGLDWRGLRIANLKNGSHQRDRNHRTVILVFQWLIFSRSGLRLLLESL